MTAPSDEGSPSPHPSATAVVASTAKSILEFVSTAAGFAAIFSALMLYFGYVRSKTLLGYFGVPIGTLNFSTTDYLLRSPGVLFKPVLWTTLVLAVFCGLAYWALRIEAKSQPRPRRALRAGLAVLTVVAVAVGILGLLGVIFPWLGGYAFALCGALLIIQFDVRRRSGDGFPLPVVIIGVLLVLGAAFWLTSIYAQHAGVNAADDLAHRDGALPSAVIYSKNALPLAGSEPGPPGTENDPDSWKIYGGYKVLIYANDRWFLIRDEWSEKDLTVILVDDSANLQVALLPTPSAPETIRAE